MDTQKFLKAYNQSRNGCNYFVRHPLVPSFHYTDGVQEVADCGCHWLVDVAATEVTVALRKSNAYNSILEVRVAKSKAVLKLTIDDDLPAIWRKRIGFTDMPDGDFNFEIVDEGERFAMTLISEH